MRFSGHETFAIREGWLYKGLTALRDHPTFYEEPFPADRLGVGSNMAKSIKHWLVASGLAHYGDKLAGSRARAIDISEFGRAVLDGDPYFNKLGTWCFIHTNLVNSQDTTAAWQWFFTSCADTVFGRSDVQEQFRRWSNLYSPKSPSPTTLQKDLNCLLSSYAHRTTASERVDPEEAVECPLWDLELLDFYQGSARFRVNRQPKKLPAEAIGYALSLTAADSQSKRAAAEVTFEDACQLGGGPGKVFLMGPSALYDCLAGAIEDGSKGPIQIKSLAGQRVISFRNQNPVDWVKHYYDRTGS
jgi:hypothetical protein